MIVDAPKRSGRATITSAAGQSVHDGSKTPTNATDWQAQPESQAAGPSLRMQVAHSQTMKTALQIANAADDVMFSLGQRTIDAVCQAVRAALDRLWNIMATREAAVALKDVPFGKPVKCGSARPFPLVRCYVRVIGNTLDVWPRPNDIQSALKVIVNTVETSTKGILAWGREGRCKTLPIKPRRSSDEDEAFKRVRARAPKRPQSTSHSPSLNPQDSSQVKPTHTASTNGADLEMVSNVSQTSAGRTSLMGATQRRSEVVLPQSTSEEDVVHRASVGGMSVGQPSLQSIGGGGLIGGVSGSACASTGTTPSSTELESGKKLSKSTAFDVRAMMESDVSEQPVNCYREVHSDREVYRLRTFLVTSMLQMKKILFSPDGTIYEVDSLTAYLDRYASLWKKDLDVEVDEFLSASPTMHDFQIKFEELDAISRGLDEEPNHYVVGAVYISTEDFKNVIRNNLTQLKQTYVKAFIERYINQVENIGNLLEEWDRNLQRNINSLDDIAFIMDTLRVIREKEIDTDRELIQCEEANALLSKFDLPYPKDIGDRVESVRCAFLRIKERVFLTTDHILSIQGGYKDGLLESIQELKESTKVFEGDYDEKGPMVPGLPPQEALDKQIQFKNRYDNLIRKINTALKGELLFGLPPSDYSRVQQIGRELDLLQRLYGLYNEVNRTVASYYEIVWQEVDMEKIGVDLQEFQNNYNAPFRNSIQEWVQKLSTTSEVLDTWMRVQNLWVYLEAVFVGGDIAKQLPAEAKRFQGVDKTWIKVMERARDTPNVITCCASDQSLQEQLPRLLSQLELCQKSLSGYLERKRLLFPRFFFVSDPVLLEILGQASDPQAIQAHLLAIFDNTKRVQFAEKAFDILAAFSQEDEKLPMIKPVKCEGHVEHWLGVLLRIGQASLHNLIRKAYYEIADPGVDLTEFFDNQLAQIGLLGIQILWTSDATDALNAARADPKIMSKTNKHFLEILNRLIGETTRDLTKTMRTKYETLITVHVHQRDIFDDLCKQGIRSTIDFEWTKQTRTYFMEKVDKCVISITDVDFVYQK
ncbi:hypothetical protein AHF37_03032 [Paragonimus kellicotti]|nr:hypothetical protein AHF37_03032 [Paragonimus kellicotti]